MNIKDVEALSELARIELTSQEKEEMLSDIATKLKPGGLLYIDETLARRSGELHGVCRKRIYLSEELIALFKQNGYDYVDGIEMNFRKATPVRKIFAFRKV